MKISLHMNGKEMFFSNRDIISKLEFLAELEKNYSVDESDEDVAYETSPRPTENQYFKVNPASIDRSLFKEEKPTFMQEWTRKAIVSALAELGKKPYKYARPFVTIMPRKSWKTKTVSELQSIAKRKGGHIANWVEQSLEWAQRLTNGESWQSLCDSPDTANWYRLVFWRGNHPQIVGGSHKCNDILPATTVFGNYSEDDDILHFTVPLIVLYL